MSGAAISIEPILFAIESYEAFLKESWRYIDDINVFIVMSRFQHNIATQAPNRLGGAIARLPIIPNVC